jgi:hypothetical protein
MPLSDYGKESRWVVSDQEALVEPAAGTLLVDDYGQLEKLAPADLLHSEARLQTDHPVTNSKKHRETFGMSCHDQRRMMEMQRRSTRSNATYMTMLLLMLHWKSKPKQHY